MSNKTLKVGLIGIGGMGYCHYCCYDEVQEAEIVAVCDVRTDVAKEKTAARAKELGKSETPRIYGDLDEMLEKEELDMVDICTPSYLHADMAIKCLEHGLNVLTEKPMTLSAEDGARVLAAANESGKKFMAAHVVRFMSPYVYLKKAIESKKYGDLLRLDMKRISSIPLWSWEDWMRKENLSGGVGFDLSVHDLDFVFSVLGKYDEGKAHHRKITDNSAYIVSTMTYGKATVSCEAGWYNANIPFRSDFLAVFDNGYIRYEDGKLRDNGEEVKSDCAKEKKDLGINISGDNAYTQEIAYFVNRVLKDEKVTYVSPESSLLTVELTESLIKNAKNV